MPSSTSSSSADARPTVSVVIGSNAPPEALEACLAALEPQRDGAEVLVYEGRTSPPALRERFPWARFAERPGALVPELWRDGIDESAGEIVALTIAPMVPAPDWLLTIRDQHLRYDAVAGAIDPGSACGSSTGPSTSAATRATCGRSRVTTARTSRATTPRTSASCSTGHASSTVMGSGSRR